MSPNGQLSNRKYCPIYIKHKSAHQLPHAPMMQIIDRKPDYSPRQLIALEVSMFQSPRKQTDGLTIILSHLCHIRNNLWHGKKAYGPIVIELSEHLYSNPSVSHPRSHRSYAFETKKYVKLYSKPKSARVISYIWPTYPCVHVDRDGHQLFNITRLFVYQKAIAHKNMDVRIKALQNFWNTQKIP